MSNDIPVLFKHIQSFMDLWKGFNEQDYSRLPTQREKQQMARYPVCSSIIQLTIQPLLAPKWNVEGDARQKAYIEHWLNKYYRRIMATVLRKAIPWGYACGERVLATETIPEGTFVFHRGIICPEPFNTQLMFNSERPEISGFTYMRQYRVDRRNGDKDNLPGMVYYAFRGEETSAPQGEGLLNDMFWSWQLLMKEWTSWVVYKRMKVPIWVLYYLKDPAKSGTDLVDTNKEKAMEQLEATKNAGGIALPKMRDGKGEFAKAWELTSAEMQDREPGYHASIRLLNSLMYVAALIPERLMEQFKDTGSQAMVSVQKDFFTENILAPRVAELGEYVDEWFIAPMVRANFAKPDYKVTFAPLDTMSELYLSIVEAAIKGGREEVMGLLNWEAIAQKTGLEILPENEREEKPEPPPFPGVKPIDKPDDEDEKGKEFQRTRGEQKETVRRHAEKWVRQMNARILEVKDKLYDRIRGDLVAEQGRVSLAVKRLFERDAKPDPDAVAAAVQIPDRIYKSCWPFMEAAWKVGMTPVIDGAKKLKPTPYMKEPSRDITRDMENLLLDFEGYAGGSIAGEGELLERRLFAAVRFAEQTPAGAFRAVNEAFNKYVDTILPQRIINLVHSAAVAGTKDAIAFLLERDAKEKRGG